jgi:hypothetical protein
MKNRLHTQTVVSRSVFAANTVLAFLLLLLVCGAQQEKGKAISPNHDLSGVWEMPPEAYGHYDQSFGTTDLPMTPWAQAKFDAAKPSEGPKSVTIADSMRV